MRYYYILCMGLICATFHAVGQSIPHQSGNTNIRNLRKIESVLLKQRANVDLNDLKKAQVMSQELLRFAPESRIQLADIWLKILSESNISELSKSEIEVLLSMMCPFIPSARYAEAASVFHKLSLRKESLGNLSQASLFSKQAIEFSPNPNRQLQIYLNQYGYLLYQSGQYNAAAEIFRREIKLCDKLGLHQEVARALNNLGSIYLKFNAPRKALRYFQRSTNLRKHQHDQQGLINLYINMGSLHVQINQLDSANILFKNAATLAQLIEDKLMLGIAHCNLAEILIRKNKLKKAQREVLQAQEHLAKIEADKWLGHCFEKLGRIHLALNQPAQAKNMIEKGLNYAEKSQNIELQKRVHETSYHIYLQLNRSEKALEHLAKFVSIRDSLNNLQALSQFLMTESESKLNQNTQNLSTKYEQELRTSQQLNKQQKALTYSIAGGLILALVLGFYLYHSVTEIRSQRNKLQLQGVQLSNQHAHLSESHKEIRDSIAYAQRIQNAILPYVEDVREVFPESFMIYEPKDTVAGDFYWIQAIDDSILFAVADCTGHGVPGAMVSVICINALNRCVREHRLSDPGEILNKTKEIVIAEFEQAQEDIKDGMDIALCRVQGNVLSYSGANNPIWIRRMREWIIGKPARQPIGKHLFSKPFKTWSVPLEKGDKVYLFSDGFQDQFGGEKGKKLKKSKMQQWVEESAVLSMDEQRTILLRQFNNWKGEHEQVDDVCFMGIQF